MGVLVRLIGSGVGLAAEAIAAKKQRSHSRSPGADLSPQASASSSRDIGPSSSSFTNKSEKKSSAALEAHEDFETPPPPYEQVVEVPEEQVDELIANGKALPLDEKHGLSEEREVHEDDDSDSDSEGDEANWALDEAAEEVATPRAEDPKLKYGIMAQPTIESFSAVVMAKCPPLNHPTNPLQRPVIIPQRRPGARDRGFIHAYSPDLAEKGISQETFLSFIQNFHAASQASPLLNVVSVSAGVAGLVPEPITQITSTIIQFAAGAAIYLQTTQRTHSFLDEMNDKLFKPRGLYAMVMKYIPQGTRPISVQQTDLNTMISKENAPHKSYQNFRAVNAGRSYGAIEMPDSAPLIFPALDEAAQTQDPVKANNLKNRMAFVADYYDKRAQASYVRLSFLPPPPGLNPLLTRRETVAQKPRPTPGRAATGLRDPGQRSQPSRVPGLLAHAVLRGEDPTESGAAGTETREEDPGGRRAEPENGEEGVEAEEEIDEAECLVSDDCQFADGAGDGGGEGAGAAGGGGGDEVGR